MAIPTIFVIFQDHQCYPEYLITFEHVWLLKTLMDYIPATVNSHRLAL
jgi:hypothetical protein